MPDGRAGLGAIGCDDQLSPTALANGKGHPDGERLRGLVHAALRTVPAMPARPAGKASYPEPDIEAAKPDIDALHEQLDDPRLLGGK
jgi:hypothetical protein